jgi:hypothetical protein
MNGWSPRLANHRRLRFRAAVGKRSFSSELLRHVYGEADALTIFVRLERRKAIVI